MLKAQATPQQPLACTSAKVIGAAAARIGLQKNTDSPTILPFIYLLAYSHTALLTVASRRSVYIFHYVNGAVPSALCSGIVAKTLDSALRVCTDLGASTRTDRPTVRAWALRAEATVSASTKAQPILTSGQLTFIACEAPLFPKSADPGTTAFQMNIYVQHSGASHSRGDCAR